MSIPTPFNPLGTLGGELSPGYLPVDSVWFDHDTVFDTGVVVDSYCTLRACVMFDYSKAENVYGDLIGNDDIGLFFSTVYGYAVRNNASNTPTDKRLLVKQFPQSQYIFECVHNNELNTLRVRLTNMQGVSFDGPVYNRAAFASRGETALLGTIRYTRNLFLGRLWWAQIIDNDGMLKSHIVACRNPQNELSLYDTIQKRELEKLEGDLQP